MILQALVQLAAIEGLCDDPDFEFKPVAWYVRLQPDGTLINIESTYNDPPVEPGSKKKPKPVPKQLLVPRFPTGKAGIKAPSAFLVENAKYVFGRPTADKSFDEEEGREKSGWFRDQLRECASATGDAGVQAVLTFLDAVDQGKQVVALNSETKSNELFAFLVGTGSDFVHQRPAVRSYWQGMRKGTGQAPPPNATRCLVSGEAISQVDLFPLIKRLPGGATSGCGLVGFNQRSFESHGWSGNENAPVSRAAAEAAATALNRLLNPETPDPQPPHEKLPRRRLSLGGETVLVYWAPKARKPETIDFFSDVVVAEPADPELVAEIYKSVWRGKAASIDDPAEFYAMILSGAQGRAVVRDWMETTVGDVYANLAEHFRDLAIVRNTSPAKGKSLPPAVPLGMLLGSLAPPGKSDPPAALSADFVRAAITGRPYPLAILQKALLRERAEAGGDEWIDSTRRDARAALMKAVLNRRRRFYDDAAARYPEVNVNMNPNTKSNGYNLGALLAVMERLQTEALGNVNASVIDKYFAAASATPRVVFNRLLKGARHHARKALDEDYSRATGLERLLDELVSRFSPESGGFPSSLDIEQQGLFVIGYHHMRKFLWMNREERDAWMKEYPDAPNAFGRRKNETSAEAAV